MKEDLWLETEYGRIHGKSAGNGPLVLAVHGWSQRNDWRTWEALIEPLAAGGLRVVSLDMPGWGKSPAITQGQLSAEKAAAIIMAVLDALNEETAAIMGKSWGGGVALHVALAYPARTTRLVLTAPAFSDTTILGGVKVPVLLVWAEDDKVIPIGNAKKYLQRLPEITFVQYERGGHSAASKNAEDFAPKAISFLRGTLA